MNKELVLNNKMLKAVLIKPGQFKLVSDDIPKINDDGILVNVIYAGICGSDIHSFQGENSLINYPVVLGHEFVGKVVGLGKKVNKFEKGDLVTGEPIIPCNNCIYCKTGDYNLCMNLKVMPGAFCEYIVLKEFQAYKIPLNINLEDAIFIEPLSVALHSIEISNIDKDLKIIVMGAGTIGQMVLQLVKAFNLGCVAVVDLIDYKLKIAKLKGADFIIDLKKANIEKSIINVFDSEPIDVVFDCVGNDSSIYNSINIVKKGGKIIIIGQAVKNLSVDMCKVMLKQIKIFGSCMYKNNFKTSIEVLGKNIINFSGYISNKYRLKNIQEAFEDVSINNHRYIKCLIKI